MSGQSLNHVTLIGNLGIDPELVGNTDDPIGCRFTLATTERWTPKDGGPVQERTTWHRVTVFGGRGRACFEHLTKGRLVYVQGRIETRKYEDKDGVTRWATEIVASEVGFLGSNPRRQRVESAPMDPGAGHRPEDDRPLERRPGDRPANRPAWDRKR
jgi:single-strand DNA-binding protein